MSFNYISMMCITIQLLKQCDSIIEDFYGTRQNENKCKIAYFPPKEIGCMGLRDMRLQPGIWHSKNTNPGKETDTGLNWIKSDTQRMYYRKDHLPGTI